MWGLFLTALNDVECSCGQIHIHLVWEGLLLISVVLSLDNLDQMVASQHYPGGYHPASWSGLYQCQL